MENDQNKLDLKAVVAMGVGGMVGGGIFSALLILFRHLFKTDKQSLCIIAGMYTATIIAELVFSKRRLVFRKGA